MTAATHPRHLVLRSPRERLALKLPLRAVLMRFVISDVTTTSARFVQSYSVDGGQTWIDNWTAIDTRRR